ncbi:hypothetical protein [Christiangramia aquimixticola]|uniref:hypothetical protein n=1 Tax=Christiangramia aquimixticola TaxID=1697558 RepID=UPI003AA90331
MRRLLTGIFLLSLFTSCDDGEIIVTSFDFEDSTFKFCEGSNGNVIYAVNDDDVSESISLEFSNNQWVTDEDGTLLPPSQEEISFPLTGNNRVIYRIYSSSLNGDQYFCQVVPPSSPQVIEEWVSGTGATVIVKTGFIDETANADPDRDGLKNINEGWNAQGTDLWDTDEDGIPDYLDKDDDGDNVPTSIEITNNVNDPVTSDGYRDTDEDGIPNYLDNDDDNDNVLTRLEVEEGSELNPESFSSTGDGIPNYLNDQQTFSLTHNKFISHDIQRNYGYQILIENLKLTKVGSSESIQYVTYNFGTLRASGIDFDQCPLQDIECQEQ